MKLKIKSFFLFLIFVFLSAFLSSKNVFTLSCVSAQVNQQTATQTEIINELNSVKTELDKLKDENYQGVLRASSNTIEKVDQYTDRLTFLATVLGIFLSIFSVFFAVIAIFFAYNFSLAKKEFAESLKEIKGYLSIAKRKAKFIKKLADEAGPQREVIFAGREEIAKLLATAEKTITKAKKAKVQTSKELDKMLEEIKNNEAKVRKEVLQATKNIQSLSSLATIASESPSVSPFPSYSLSPSPSPMAEGDKILPANKKCSNCGKMITELEAFLTGQELCSECKAKEASKSQK